MFDHPCAAGAQAPFPVDCFGQSLDACADCCHAPWVLDCCAALFEAWAECCQAAGPLDCCGASLEGHARADCCQPPLHVLSSDIVFSFSKCCHICSRWSSPSVSQVLPPRLALLAPNSSLLLVLSELAALPSEDFVGTREGGGTVRPSPLLLVFSELAPLPNPGMAGACEFPFPAAAFCA